MDAAIKAAVPSTSDWIPRMIVDDIAIEAADVALMSSDLKAVLYPIRLGRKVV